MLLLRIIRLYVTCNFIVISICKYALFQFCNQGTRNCCHAKKSGIHYAIFRTSKSILHEILKEGEMLRYCCQVHIPSVNTQSCIKGLLVVQDFCFWAIWAAGPVLKKKSWADYEQLLRVVFSCFQGQKNSFYRLRNSFN